MGVRVGVQRHVPRVPDGPGRTKGKMSEMNITRPALQPHGAVRPSCTHSPLPALIYPCCSLCLRPPHPHLACSCLLPQTRLRNHCWLLSVSSCLVLSVTLGGRQGEGTRLVFPHGHWEVWNVTKITRKQPSWGRPHLPRGLLLLHSVCLRVPSGVSPTRPSSCLSQREVIHPTVLKVTLHLRCPSRRRWTLLLR